MTPTQREAIELAIADFEHIPAASGHVEFVERRIAAPVQEPVAWWKQYPDGSISVVESRTFLAEDAVAMGWRALGFTDVAPQAQQPAQTKPPLLTDEEVGQLTVFAGLHDIEMTVLAEFIRAIERVVRRQFRQTQPAPVQEPIGYLAFRDGKPSWDEDCVCEDAVYPVDADDDRVSVAIYTAPQPDRIAQLEAANTNLFEQGQKMHKRIQELERDCKIGAQEMVATTTSPTAIQWPKARDVGRYGDMSQEAHMRVGLDSDNDVFVSVWDGAGGATVEFCTPGAGGGKSSETRMALIALMVAMEKDNARTPRLDWWAQRMGAAVIDAAMEAK